MEGFQPMINANDRTKLRALALLAALTMALGAAACGDDDDGGGDSSNVAQEAETTFDNSPEGQIKQAYSDFVDLFYSKRPAEVCGQLTQSAAKRMGKGFGGCEKRLAIYFKESNLSQDKPYVVKLRIDGPRAIAMVKTKKSNRYPVPFRRQNGEWKVDGGWNGT